MYLSRLRINWRHRLAQRDLSYRDELHRTVLSAFPERMPSEERVLYRLELHPDRPYATLLVQSQTLPIWDQSKRLSKPRYLFQSPELRCIQPQFQEGMRLPFRLQGNSTVKRLGKRCPIYDEGGQMGWLQRKGQQHGFDVDPLYVRIVELDKLYGKRRQQTWHVVQFDGILQVVEPEIFASALREGIGSAKAFGCGLLSVPYPTARAAADVYSPQAWG